MSQQHPSEDSLQGHTEEFLTRALCYANLAAPAMDVRSITFKGGKGRLKVRVERSQLQRMASRKFIPTANQQDMLTALRGCSLRTDALSSKSNVERATIFMKPRGGIHELIDRGLVGHHKRLGYYSTEFPPPELEELDG